MSDPTYSFIRYLSAKKTVDDRALNRHVWDTMANATCEAATEDTLRVLEVGAGIGTMVERLLERGALTQAEYTMLDAQPANIEEAWRRLPAWACEREFVTFAEAGSRLRLRRGEQLVYVAAEAVDLFDFIAREQGERAWDLLIAHAFLDLMDVPTRLPQLFSLLRPNGFFYFTINFDGVTIFEPALDRYLDQRIVRLYHQSMDERITDGAPAGDSRTGRHLFHHLRAAAAEILAAGSSDWVVHANAGEYRADEAYFLHFIINTIASELTGHPELNAAHFDDWVAERHAQIELGELIYIAHQIDVFGRMPCRH